jgi:DNA-binding GntR family transcriptional regulator
MRIVSTTKQLKPIAGARVSLAQLVGEALERAISTRELKPGMRVTESELASQLAVSKTPVREALLRLQFMGIIEPDGVRGGRIVQPSMSAIREAYELREALEVHAARLAALRATPVAADRIQAYADESLAGAQAGDVAAFRRADRAFHQHIAAASGNGKLASFIDNALVLTWTLRLRDVPMADDSLECASQHQAVARAIRDGAAEAAAQAMGNHLRTVSAIVTGAFEATLNDTE